MIIKGPSERFSTAPAGTFPAVCVDEIDLGELPDPFGEPGDTRHMCRIVWQFEDEDGAIYLVKQDYTASLHEKAKLRSHLEAWRGRSFTEVELFGFDLETIVGTGCLLSVVHRSGSKGGTFANVGAVMKLRKTEPVPAIKDYIRVKDRKPAEPAPAPAAPKRRPVEMAAPFEIDDSDVPF